MKNTYISKSAVIYPGVRIGKGTFIDDFVVLGRSLSGRVAEKAVSTCIGKGAIIRSHTVIYAGNKIGDNFSTGHGVMIREENHIGNNVSIGTGSCIEHHIRIGNGVRIHSKAFVPEYSVLEDGSWIGPNVVITNVLHPLCPKAKACAKGAHIKRNAKIGANSTLCPAITIGEGALVGAGSTVTGNVRSKEVVCGNPARTIKNIKQLKCRFALIGRPYK